MTDPRIIFFGNERLSTGQTTYAPTLRGLVKSNYNVVGVVVNQSAINSRSTRKLEVEEVALENQIPIYQPKKLSEFSDTIKSLKPDIGILVAYGKIIPEEIIKLFPYGIINIHPSLLPKYRGTTPIESALLDGVTESGVSIMKLVSQMDAGPIYVNEKVDISPNETKANLTNLLTGIGAQLLLDNLRSILSGELKPIPQDESKASFTNKITKADGQIDWKLPAIVIERQIRAYADWPKSKCQISSLNLTLLEAQVIDAAGKPGDYTYDSTSLTVFCGTQAIRITKLQPEGKNPMPIKAFLAGYKDRLK